MAYVANKPDPTDAISTSQAVLKENFTQLKTFLDVNHVDFSDTTDYGKHNFLQMPNLTVGGSIPAATSATEYALYTTSSGLFIRPPSQTAGIVSNDLNVTGGTFATAAGTCTLPCGLILKWGTKTFSSGDQLVTFASAFSSACYNVQITQTNLVDYTVTSNICAVVDLATTGFRLLRPSWTYALPVNWLAIGK